MRVVIEVFVVNMIDNRALILFIEISVSEPLVIAVGSPLNPTSIVHENPTWLLARFNEFKCMMTL